MGITISDVARMANVSKATVSAVLNEKASVSKKTRQKVMDAVQKLNYTPNHVARSLSKRETKSIGLVIKEIDNPFFARLMKGVFDTCAENDYTVLLGSSELLPAKEIMSIETLKNQRVDGLIISPLQGEGVDFFYLVDLIRDNFPFILLEQVKNFPTNVVDINNVEAAYKAVSYLINLGHRNIAYFTGPQYSFHNTDRLEGYRQALIDNNLPILRKNTIQVGSYIKDGYREGKKFFSSKSEQPSAVFCFNDLVAIGLIDALIEIGLRIPEDVSVIGCDNIDFCNSVKIPLTTMEVPIYEIGQKAAELLLKQIQHRDTSLNEKIILNSKLIERRSCKRLES